MEKNRKKYIRWLFITEAIFLLLFGVAVQALQSSLLVSAQKKDLIKSIETIPSLIEKEQEDLADNEESFDKVYRSKASQASYILKHVDSVEHSVDGLRTIAKLLGVSEVHLMHGDGTVIASNAEPVLPLTAEHAMALGAPIAEEAYGIHYRTYASEVDWDTYVVIRSSAEQLIEIEHMTSDISTSLGGISLGLNGLVYAFNDEGQVLYSSEEDLLALTDNVYASGMPEKAVQEDDLRWVNLNGEYYYTGFRKLETEDAWVGLAIPNSSIRSQVMATAGIIIFCAFLIVTIMNLYAVFLYNDAFNAVEKDISKALESGEDVSPDELLQEHNKQIRSKLNIVFIIGTILTFLIAVYTQILSNISLRTVSNREDLLEIQERLNASEANVTYLKEVYEDYFANKALTAAYILGENPELMNREDLQELNDALNAEYLIVFDTNGKEVVSSDFFTGIEILDDPESQTYALRRLMFGYPVVVTDPAVGDFSGDVHQDIGASIRTDGEFTGFVVMSVAPQELINAVQVASLESTLEAVQITQGGFVFSVDKDDKTFTYYPNASYVGRDATEYGLKDSEIRDAFNGFIRLFEKNYYASTMETSTDIIVYTVTANKVLSSSAWMFALQVCVLIFLGLLVMTVQMRMTIEKGLKSMRKRMVKVFDKKDQEEDQTHVEVVMPDGTIKRTVSILQRISLESMNWDVLTPEQKILTVLKAFLTLFAIGAAVTIIARDRIFADDSILLYILNKEWERGFNIFSLTHCVITVCIIFVLHYIIMKVLAMVPQITGPKGETVIRLIRSLVKYISVLAAIYYCLGYIGIDSATLLASAGLFTLVIGLGAQSLISDILSGLFIIFEGEFQVGDIVTIDDYRGTVQEIGIRTTKIMGYGGNIKIIRNSNVNNILNMTRKTSVCFCVLTIEYQADLEKTIRIFTEELPRIKEAIPQLLDEPTFDGVSELGENGVSLRFSAPCAEADRYGATYALNRELKNICEKYHINIPYPQVVIHPSGKL